MKNIRIFYLKIFIFLVVKVSVYLNRHVFVMDHKGTREHSRTVPLLQFFVGRASMVSYMSFLGHYLPPSSYFSASGRPSFVIMTFPVYVYIHFNKMAKILLL